MTSHEHIVKKSNTLVTWSLCLLLGCIIAINVIVVKSYVHLQQSRPLENFRGSFISPVSLSKDTSIVGTGTYDRNIVCQMTDFDIHLSNASTKDSVLIGPENLLKAPPANLNPGKNIPIEFDVSIPSTLYPGVWKTEFHGTYNCRVGLFMAIKSVSIQLSSLIVTE